MNFIFDDFLKIHNHSAMFYVEKLSYNYLDTYLCKPKNKENPYSIIINFPIIWHCDIKYKYIHTLKNQQILQKCGKKFPKYET